MCTNKMWIPFGDGKKVDSFGRVGRYVPCGHCLECLQKRQNEWYVRFWLETYAQKRRNPNSLTLFITLTYEEKYLPKCRKDALNDFRAFIKKVRRRYPNTEIRFYVASEHGTEKGRFHYHCLVFGFVKDENDRRPFQKVFSELWNKGFVTASVADGKKFHYCSKYVTKDMDVCKGVDDWPVICTCSKRPALGVTFLTENMCRYYNDNYEKLVIPIDGYMYSVPRYLRTKLLSELNLFLSKTVHVQRFQDDCFMQEYEKGEQELKNVHDIYAFKKLRNIQTRERFSHLRQHNKNLEK